MAHRLIPWQWREDGTWHLVHDLLQGDVRVAAGKRHQPSAGILDRRLAKTRTKGLRGYDAHKQVKRCKRHLLVHMLGLIPAMVVTAVSVQDLD
jgi:hypothetical protein